jgi:hypothetical protein
MRPCSEDLPGRVVGAVEVGTPRREVARRFSVERAVAAAAVKRAALVAALPGRLAERADGALAEQCAWWRDASGVAVSPATMSRALAGWDDS